jgi:glycosyltransferase involved in cell wall biosynthesis
VTVGTRLPADWDTYDVIVGSRVAQPGASHIWQAMRDAGVRTVLDLDDDYFHIEATNQAAYNTWVRGGLLDSLAKNITLADRVTVCSDTLARVVSNLHDDVRVVPNGLPAQYLGMPREYRPDTLTVGWAGTPSTIEGLYTAARHLNRVVAYRDTIEGLLVGPTVREARGAGVRHPRISTTGWLSGWGAYASMAYEFDVWLAPYPDTVFNRAKFPTKALEAGFFGIPLIASDVGAYREWITHGVNGFLVAVGQEHLFGRYLKQLVDDPALRQSLGIAARARASQNILQGLALRWEDALAAPHSTGGSND